MATAAPGRLAAWMRGHVPTRESIERNRWLRPFSARILHPSLWHLNRRSVPRGVALGLATSALVPVAHMPAAALLSVPFRANLPIAVAITVPSTFLIPGMWWLAYRIGRSLLHANHQVGHQIASNVKAQAGWLHWIFAQAGPATIIGLLILAALMATLGYALASVGWRWRTGYRWRHRHARR